MLRTFILFSALVLAACDEQAPALSPPPGAPAQEPGVTAVTPAPEASTAPLPSLGPKVQTRRKAEIDWASARKDLQTAGDGSVRIQSAGEAPADVPVLVPTGIVTSQSAGEGPVFRRTADGYFAFYPGEAYNIIVNGTNLTVEADALAETNTERAPVYSSSEAGAQVWLTRYGADYTVEFECNILDEQGTCITEDAALDIANNLIVSGSR